MRRVAGLDELIAALPESTGRVCRPHTAGPVEPDSTFLMLADGEPDRESWATWYPVEVLRRVPWGSASIASLVEEWFRPHGLALPELDDGEIPRELTIPAGMAAAERRYWWALAPRITAWEFGVGEHCPSASRIELAAAEHRLSVELPAALRDYYLTLGVVETVEGILPLAPERGEGLQPLIAAYPGIAEMALDEATMALVESLICFGDYLGNGNLWCVHRADGAVWYFDHDSGLSRVLTRMFADPGEYFDALTVRAIGHAHEVLGGVDHSERELAGWLGADRVRTWLY